MTLTAGTLSGSVDAVATLVGVGMKIAAGTVIAGLDYSTRARIRVHAFVRTKNPVYALLLLAEARSERVDPPKLVLRWLAKCAAQWLADNGKVPMDRVMELRYGNGNKATYFQYAKEERNQVLVHETATLRALAKTEGITLTVLDAAFMVERRFRQANWKKDGWDVDAVGHDTIAKAYNERSSGKNAVRIMMKAIKNWTPQKKREHLGQFSATYPGTPAQKALFKLVGVESE
jgi:hypothetical protein